MLQAVFSCDFSPSNSANSDSSYTESTNSDSANTESTNSDSADADSWDTDSTNPDANSPDQAPIVAWVAVLALTAGGPQVATAAASETFTHVTCFAESAVIRDCFHCC